MPRWNRASVHEARPPDHLVITDSVRPDQVGVATGNDEREKRKRHRFLQHDGEQMAFEVVDPHDREVAGVAQGFGRVHPDEQGHNKAGTVCDADQVNVLKGDVRLPQGLLNDQVNGFDMPPPGQFRHNAPVLSMDFVLRPDHIGKEPVAVFENGGGGFIARGFDTQDTHK